MIRFFARFWHGLTGFGRDSTDSMTVLVRGLIKILWGSRWALEGFRNYRIWESRGLGLYVGNRVSGLYRTHP